MSDHRVPCMSREQNFGITCVRAYPTEPARWCNERRWRRNLKSGPTVRLSNMAVTDIETRLQRHGVISSDDGRLLLAEVVRTRK